MQGTSKRFKDEDHEMKSESSVDDVAFAHSEPAMLHHQDQVAKEIQEEVKTLSVEEKRKEMTQRLIKSKD